MVKSSDIDRENRIAPILNLRYCECVGAVGREKLENA